MMFAKRIELNVLNDHHFVIVDVEERVVKHVLHRLPIAASQKLDRLLHALRRSHQPIPRRILSDAMQQLRVNLLKRRLPQLNMRCLSSTLCWRLSRTIRAWLFYGWFCRHEPQELQVRSCGVWLRAGAEVIEGIIARLLHANTF